MALSGVRLQTEPTVALIDDNGASVPLRPNVQRLLAALHHGGAAGATVADLVTSIWGDSPPNDPIGSLHTTVTRLRRVLPTGALVRADDTYVLSMPTNAEPTAPVAPASSASVGGPANPIGVDPPLQRPVVVRPWTLVGRDEVVHRALERAEQGVGTVFHGGTGVGKSRVADEVVHRLSEDGWPAIVLRARAGADDVPLGVFAPLLSDDLPTGALPMLVAARHAIGQRLGGRRWVLGVDDAHQLDPASALLVAQLAMHGDAVVVATHRSAEVVHDTIAQLWIERFCEHVHLGDLDHDDTIDLVGTVARSVDTANQRDAERIWQLSHGNPLFVTTLVRHPDLGAAASDPSLEQLIADQLADVPDTLRDALAVVAVAEPIGADIVEELADPGALVALERRHLITLVPNGRRLDIHTRHPLYGEHLRRTMSTLLARGIRAQLADAVVARGARRRDDPVRVATWSLDGGRTVEPDLGVVAARRALAAHDTTGARRIGRAVWDHDADVRAARVLIDAEYVDGDTDAIVDLAVRIIPLSQGHDRTRVVETVARTLAMRAGDTDAAFARLAEQPMSPRLTAVTAQLLGYAGRADEALATLATIDPADIEPRDQVLVTLASATAMTQVGDARRALDLLDRCLESFGSMGDLAPLVTHQLTAARARPLLHLGRLDEAEAALRVGLEGARADGDVIALAMNGSALGGLLPWLGRPSEAVERASEALDTFHRTGHRTMARWAALSLGFAAVTARRSDDAGRAIVAVDQVETVTMVDGVRPLITAGLAVLRHDDPTVRAELIEGARWCRERGIVFEEACALYELARRLQAEADELDRLDELAGAHGGFVTCFAEHARARAAHDAERLAGAADMLARNGAHGLAADAAARAAEAAAEAGRSSLAQRLTDQWRDHLVRCDALVALGPLAAPDPLTARERAVAHMAAVGSSNAEIAERLGVARRTIDNHVGRILSKLGIEGRHQLAPLLGLADRPGEID